MYTNEPLHTKQSHADSCTHMYCKDRFPLRKISIGSDRIGLFFILYYPHRWMKKVENTTTLYHRIIVSNWNRKLVPKAYARFQFCSNPVRSHAYFLEWKPALTVQGVPQKSDTIEIISLFLNRS